MKPKGRIALSFSFVGSLGSASVTLMMVVLDVCAYRELGNKPPGLALVGGLMMMSALALWVIGIVGIVRVRWACTEVKHRRKAKVSYALECVLPAFLLLPPFVIMPLIS